MKVVLTNLSDYRFREARTRLNNSARQLGIAHINSYDFEDIKQTPFYEENREILDIPTGSGCWLWKPYIILETMRQVEEGDIVVYSDAGIELIDSIEPLVRICKKEQPVLLFANGNLPNSMWTKRDCFILMGCDHKKYWRGTQCDGAFALFRKCAQSIAFLQEWLEYGKDKRIITDIPNTLGKKNLPDFIAHRRDQSILSLLAARHHIPMYRMPTQYGNHYKLPAYRIQGEFNCADQYYQKQVSYYSGKPMANSPYGQLLDHHRAGKRQDGEAVRTGRFENLGARIRRKLYLLWVRLDERILNG
ncbi:hypothetical protein [Chitinophaga japonensis]|uniref:Uncharacterized protein n=1 Tax=Chitinophaga japonensis TaxID=104662 RepID=A0A562T035_CHIJA|nr:hypothetical protein [Chitinophaga japonensis]TWI86881.1 hypothetical protein LX66_4148 [Chitinophaga japonensis]